MNLIKKFLIENQNPSLVFLIPFVLFLIGFGIGVFHGLSVINS